MSTIDAPLLTPRPATDPVLRSTYRLARSRGGTAYGALIAARVRTALPAADVLPDADTPAGTLGTWNVVRDGVRFRIVAHPDPDSSPIGETEADGGWASDAVVRAWYAGHWAYLGVTVEAYDLVTAAKLGESSMWGREYGDHFGTDAELAALDMAGDDMLGEALGGIDPTDPLAIDAAAVVALSADALAAYTERVHAAWRALRDTSDEETATPLYARYRMANAIRADRRAQARAASGR